MDPQAQILTLSLQIHDGTVEADVMGLILSSNLLRSMRINMSINMNLNSIF